jgi:hypothetical protein
MDATKTSLILPIAVVSPTDIARMLKELENLDEFFRQSAIRTGGSPQEIPRYSRLLDEVVVANKLNLLQADNRESLQESFHDLAEHAPVLHISFSVDPPGPYVQKIVDWLRHNIESTILVRIGLQPNIGAGCVVRSTNKSFDFSLRKFFESKHDFFMDKLHEVLTPEEVADPMLDTQAVVKQEVAETVVAENITPTVVTEAAPQESLVNNQVVAEPEQVVTTAPISTPDSAPKPANLVKVTVAAPAQDDGAQA